ncbi:hypothetical protein BH23PSE1_BH23PSE1_18390 [soil metagenome]
MGYVDGYLLPLLEGNVERYKETARAMGEMFREHGALSVVGCLADDAGATDEKDERPAGVQVGPRQRDDRQRHEPSH